MDATAAESGLLESLHNRVTKTIGFEVAKHRCRCWFCPDCCRHMGFDLRQRLKPILSTFSGLLLVTLTIDPSLFASPQQAYFYVRKRRCIARTIQDLWRAGCLHSRRYFYVVEWQKNTEQAHFHILLDASFVPWQTLLQSWSKHRPATAGPVVGARPAFGTALISKPNFVGGADHAALYVTKYLTKVPEYGFPAWVLNLGAETRVRRYSTSRGFWEEETEPPLRETERKIEPVSYRRRVATCARTVDVFELRAEVDTESGEVEIKRVWAGELAVESEKILSGEGPPGRRILPVQSVDEVEAYVADAVHRPVEWRRGGHPKPKCRDVEERWTAEEQATWRHAHYSIDAEIQRFLESLKC